MNKAPRVAGAGERIVPEAAGQGAIARRTEAYRIALGILGDADAAEDVAQDLLVRLGHAAPGLGDEHEERRWAYRVTVNLCRDRLRIQRRRRGDIPLDEASDHPALLTEDHPERRLDLERARAAVAEAMERLPGEQREVLALRFIAGLPYGEIARLVATPQGTVASRVYRALRRLGEQLDPRHLEVLE